MVLGLVDQLLIFWQLHLIELVGLLQIWGFSSCSRLSTGFGILVFFTSISLMEFQVRYLVLFHLFLVIDGFRGFWMGSRHKNIQLMLEVLQALFLVQHFSYNTLMTFLILLSVILLSMLMILLSTLIVIRHLISSNKWNWLLASNLIYGTGQGQEVVFWFQCWSKWAGFVWLV